MSEENKIRDAADAIKGIAEAVPVYQDVIQPAAKEVGVALQTVAKTIHIALTPISALVWGYEEIKGYIAEALVQRLKGVPEERIITPSPTVAGPILEALRFAGPDPDLRELYANLLASSMDATTAKNAHPAFVEIIRQMTPDEARLVKPLAAQKAYTMISVGESHVGQLFPSSGSLVQLTRNIFLKHFSLLPYDADCSHPDLFLSYLDNLRRLGLIEVKEDYHLVGEKTYEPLEKHPKVEEAYKSHGLNYPGIQYEAILLTDMGKQFCSACVV